MEEQFNYKLAIEVPVYIQKLFNDVSLKRPVLILDCCIFLIAMLILAIPPIRFVSDMLSALLPLGAVFVYLGIPFFIVMLFKKVEPDGKKIHWYLFDMVVYFVNWKMKRSVWYKEEKRTIQEEIVLYERFEIKG